jgi:hypothetical protein
LSTVVIALIAMDATLRVMKIVRARIASGTDQLANPAERPSHTNWLRIASR